MCKNYLIMKKTILSIISVFALSALSFAQSITVNVQGSATDVSGTVVTEVVTSSSPDQHVLDFDVVNNSGVDKALKITRKHINISSGWESYFCWGASAILGTCYPVYQDQEWTGGSINVANGAKGVLSSYVNPTSSGSILIRYYVVDDSNQERLDSVDVQINTLLSVEEQTAISLSIAPNPSSNFVNINAAGVTNAKVRIVDVLGNVVYNESIGASSKKVDVTSFRNGIYFVTVEGEGIKPSTRKLIIRH